MGPLPEGEGDSPENSRKLGVKEIAGNKSYLLVTERQDKVLISLRDDAYTYKDKDGYLNFHDKSTGTLLLKVRTFS